MSQKPRNTKLVVETANIRPAAGNVNAIPAAAPTKVNMAALHAKPWKRIGEEDWKYLQRRRLEAQILFANRLYLAGLVGQGRGQGVPTTLKRKNSNIRRKKDRVN